jgi:glycerate-2-kinase
MGLIQNYGELATSQARRDVLDVVEAGLQAIQPENVMRKMFTMYEGEISESNIYEGVLERSGLKEGGLRIGTGEDKWEGNLKNYSSVNLLGMGKGSAKISKHIARALRTKLKRGYVIDSVEQEEGDNERYPNMIFRVGDHPVPSHINWEHTMEAVGMLSKTSGKELTLAVICGGASSMFMSPYLGDKFDYEIEGNDYEGSIERYIDGKINNKIALTRVLLDSGADISEINTVRKHVSRVKGGQLIHYLEREDRDIVAMLFSDVPTVKDPKSLIASGPTVMDRTTKEDALAVLKKYNIPWSNSNLTETPKDEAIFRNVHNVIVLDNKVPLEAMRKKAEGMGYRPKILSTEIMGEARNVGEKIMRSLYGGEGDMLLLGGETTVKVANKKGMGGRNRELVLGALPYMREDTVVASIGSDGWDYMDYAGAIADFSTLEKASKRSIDSEEFLGRNNSQTFFGEVGGNILTGRLPSNVADLMIFSKAKKQN